MLSRFAFRHVSSATPVLSLTRHNRLAPTCVVILRDYSSDKPAVKFKSDRISVEETIANWDRANKLYFGPERDMVNFPTRTLPTYSPPARLGFIPDSWFQMFYEKTGVTGPYLLGFGLLSFLLSKEIWIVEHGFMHFIAFWGLFYVLVRKYGAQIGAYYDKLAEGLTERHWNRPMRETIEETEAVIKDAEKMIWREDGQKFLFEAKRENVDLQLEAIYRQRLAEVQQAAKRRLDYQLDVDHARRRIEQHHMVQWIVDGVMKGITPQLEKESINKCIQDLKILAAQKPATV